MAQIVLGLATSHGPQLSTSPDVWHVHVERDKRNHELWASDGKPHSYEELLARADPAIAKELTPEKFQARYHACQKALDRLGETLAKVSPDALVIIGDDQHELFDDGNMPAISVYWGETVQTRPRGSGSGLPALIESYRAHGEMDVKSYPVASELGKHLIEQLMEEGFDVAHSRYLKEGEGIGHAVGFVCRRLFNGTTVPIVPVTLNTFFPPNQPTPKRCYALGRAVRGAVESWRGNAQVAVLASGGLSHFVIDEELDRRVIRALQNRDVETLTSLPRELLNSGNSEIRNWIVTAAAVEELDMELVDFIPCYRSPAGTGCAMGFAEWA